MSTIKVNTIQNTSGVEQYTAKAWATFGGHNGTSYIATLYNSGNISSLTDIGTGTFELNFSSSLSASTYASVFGTVGRGPSPTTTYVHTDALQTSPFKKTTSTIRVTQNYNGYPNDITESYIAFHL